MNEDPKILWQSHEVEEMRFSVEELRAKTIKFQRLIRRRNLREYLAGLVVIVWCGLQFWNSHQIVPRIALAWVIAGAILYIWHLWRRGSASAVPGTMGSTDCVTFYRRELERQRDLIRSIWKRVIGPIIPALAVLALYNIAAGPRWRQVGTVLFEVALFSSIFWLSMRAARRLDRRIAEVIREQNSL